MNININVSINKSYTAKRRLLPLKPGGKIFWLTVNIILIFFLFYGGDSVSAQVRAKAKINRVDTSLYHTNFLNVTIVSNDEKPIEGLKPENFVVYENDKKQQVLEVVSSDEKNAKLYIVLVIDTSGSMQESTEGSTTPAIDDAKKATKAFLRMLGSNDYVAVMSFADGFTLLSDFTNDTKSLEQAIDSLSPNGGTGLYMATWQALDKFKEIKDGNKAVVVLTDGQDTMGGNIELPLQKSQQEGVPIFTVGLGSQVDQGSLTRMAEETGGFYRYAPSSSQLEEIYKSLGVQLKKQYWVKYSADPQHWPKTPVTVRLSLSGVPGAGEETQLRYKVPVQWWKLIISYLLVEVILIILAYFLFRLFWRNMNMDPVFATRLAIFILIFLTVIWYSVMFFLFVPILYFLAIGFVQVLLLIIPIKLMGK